MGLSRITHWNLVIQFRVQQWLLGRLGLTSEGTVMSLVLASRGALVLPPGKFILAPGFGPLWGLTSVLEWAILGGGGIGCRGQPAEVLFATITESQAGLCWEGA